VAAGAWRLPLMVIAELHRRAGDFRPPATSTESLSESRISPGDCFTAQRGPLIRALHPRPASSSVGRAATENPRVGGSSPAPATLRADHSHFLLPETPLLLSIAFRFHFVPNTKDASRFAIGLRFWRKHVAVNV